MIATMPDLWPHQSRSIRLVHQAIENGHRRICLCLPTGAGKSRVACELIRDWLACDFKVSLYTNRKMLLSQLANVLGAFGLKHGIRAAGHEDSRHLDLQVSSIQTEASRVLKKKTWQLHEADRVLIDEAHLNAGEVAQELTRMHLERGAVVVGLTATPIDIGHFYDHLIVGGTLHELRECGCLVRAIHYGPDEPDVRALKNKAEWEYSENDIRKVMNIKRVFGSIVRWYGIINPSRRPSICFAPGVPESIWLCEEFNRNGIRAAHIDGTTCILNGERYDSNDDIRNEILRASRDGDIDILCNRFVLREGIDAPWLGHGILATIFGSFQSYRQSVGRLLRSHVSMDSVTIQDHGGNWWRHGSANADREWRLDDTECSIQGERKERLCNKTESGEREPMRCPACSAIILTRKCSCGYEITRKSRPVMQTDGTMKELGGDIFKPRFTKREPNTEEIWEKTYYRMKRKGKTFSQARGLFFYENGYWPPQDMKLMPIKERDWFRKVADVPRGELR